MTRAIFSQNLRKATLVSHEKALMAVENELKPPFSYLVHLNQSHDGNPLAEGEVIPKKMRTKGHAPCGPLAHEEVVSLLWLNGLVPAWVDIMPWEASSDGLRFRLICCGRFADNEPLLYHQREGYPPFHAPGVWVPPDWKSVDESGRFDLNWHFKGKLTS